MLPQRSGVANTLVDWLMVIVLVLAAGWVGAMTVGWWNQ